MSKPRGAGFPPDALSHSYLSGSDPVATLAGPGTEWSALADPEG
jgi:hypothetical protein